MVHANFSIDAPRNDLSVRPSADAPVRTEPLRVAASDQFTLEAGSGAVSRGTPSPGPDTPAVRNRDALPVVSQLTLRREHNGQESIVTLTPRAVEAFVTAENHDEARDAIFGTEGSPVYIADPEQREVAYSVFMAEVYNRPVPSNDLSRRGDAVPMVLARPTPDFIAEMTSWVSARRERNGEARANYEAIGGDAGHLRHAESVAADFDEDMAYGYRLGVGETVASVTLAANHSLIESLATEYGVDEQAIVGAMAVVGHAVNPARDERTGLGVGSEILVVSFADPASSIRKMLEAFLARPEEERDATIRALALSHYLQSVGALHRFSEAPIATAQAALEVLKEIEGAANPDLAVRPPDDETRDVLDEILQQGVAAAKLAAPAPMLGSAFDPEARDSSGWNRGSGLSELSIDLSDESYRSFAARQQRDLERFHDELDAIGEEALKARLEYREVVAREIEREEIRKA